MGRLAGKRALVTGGRRGIGRAIVARFQAEGAQVMTCGRGPRPEDLDPAVAWVAADLADAGAVGALQVAALAELGGLEVLVNNAGLQIEKTLVDSSDADWEALMGVNAKGVFLTCRAFIPVMARGGAIINIGSISGLAADPGMALYNASKAFVHGLTRSIAVDHGPELRCNAVCPGWIMTGMAEAAFAVADDPRAAEADALARTPTGRFGTPADVAQLVLWLASDESGFANGQCFTLDGGLTAASPINPGLF